MKLGDLAPALVRHGHPCWRKQRWPTRAAAEAQIRSLLRRGLEKDPARINVYRCDGPRGCGGFHVGHRRDP